MIRFFKYFIYGLFYLAILALVAYLAYLVFFGPAPVVSDEVPESPVPEIPEPIFVFENVSTEVRGDEVRVTGVLKNDGPQIAPSVEIKATIFDKNGFEIFSSGTLQENIRAFEERPFTVFFPKDQGLAEEVGEEFTETSYTVE